jgi:hypothetical protein
VTKRNFIPFTLGFFGVASVFIGIDVNVTAGVLPGDPAVWKVFTGAFAILAAVSTQWWPAALTPGWYQDWARRGGNGQTDPWPSAKARSKGHR